MAAKALRIPQLVLHKPSGKSVVFLRQPDGRRSMVYCGPHGSAEAARRYREVLAEFLAGKPILGPRQAPKASAWPTVADLCAAFLLHAERYYRDAEGRVSSSVDAFVQAFDPLLDLHRDIATDRLSVVALEQVRDVLIESRKYCRWTINSKMRRIRQCIRWGTERRLVPPTVWYEVSAMRGLAIGRAAVRESRVVEAVPWPVVEATIPHLPTPLRAAVLVQWHSGARPGEILQMTRRMLDCSGKNWLFRPRQHKGNWRGRERVVYLGPKAQEVLQPLLKLDVDAAVFSPVDSLAEQKANRRAARVSPMTPSQRARDERNALKPPPVRDFYDVYSYRRAIARAARRAAVPAWAPHMLRHAAGTRIAQKDGVEAARIILGHGDLQVTRRYAKGADAAIAADLAAKHG